MSANRYSVYIISNKSRSVIYIGVTSNLSRRMDEHKNKVIPNSFASKYGCRDLLYFEGFGSARQAISREKQLKGWTRRKKWILIQRLNPNLEDLSNLL